MTYVLIPDTLARELSAANLGVGVGIEIPMAWRSHEWSGGGAPCEVLVNRLMVGIRSKASLPPCELLAAWPTLEASAAEAIDRLAPERVPCIFHADDPVFCASTLGGAQRILNIAADWAARHRAVFHTSGKKVVVIAAGPGAPHGDRIPLFFPSAEGVNGPPLRLAPRHRYLGLQWMTDMRFLTDINMRLHLADAGVASIAGLLAGRIIPITLAMQTFVLKVDSLLYLGRWLWACTPGAQGLLEERYQTWARALLGAQP